jgi:uncharacterized protein DUF4836
MHRNLRHAILIVLAIGLLSACNRMPDHARYIPKDAVAVAGINLKSLSKKIAWNMITGSKLFKEMQDRIKEKNTRDAMAGIEKAGVDAINTFYVYVKTDKRFTSGSRVTGLVPLSDAGEWETYLKQILPGVQITQHGDIKEASLGRDLYVGWNKHLLILMNTMGGSESGPDAGSPATDNNAAMAAEMDNAFAVKSENSVLGDQHFTKLEMEGHDVTFWLNYDQLMTQYSGNMAEKMGVSLSNSLWKDAAFTAGFDFVKGKITGEMRYFLGPDMKEIGTELGATNADNDMLSRLPSQDLDMLLALHVSPKGLKSLLDKTGLLGLANVGLSTQGLNADNVFDAFTGDMAFVMNKFSLHSENVTDSFMGQAVVHQNQKPSLDMSYVIKINKKENFQKILKLAKDLGLQTMGDGFVVPLDDKDSVYIMMNDQYAVASNKYTSATGFLKGDFKSQKMSETASARVLNHPWALYLDIQQLFKNIDPGISHSAHDSAMISESKKLLSYISANGGEFKENAFEYHLDVTFTNPDENSIIALMDYGMRMSDADKISKQ